jgi:hypothetical protein
METMLPPSHSVEGVERLDLQDLDWEEVHDAIQLVLQGLDEPVSDACAGVVASMGSNAARGLHLFSYRVYHPPLGANVDPVVVGINFTPGSHGTIVHGDVAGETLGDVLFDVSPREIIEKSDILKTARDVSEQLARQGKIVAAALEDPRRQS